jgi:hypothetical protein
LSLGSKALPIRDRPPATVGVVDEARAVLERLERIEELERAGAARTDLVAELRALVGEAEAWSRAEGGEDGQRAVGDLRSALTAPAVT